jgi:uncharacterized repeat protein (TIGR03803 family)
MRTKLMSAISAFMVFAAVPFIHAQAFTVLHKFNLKDGQNPQGTLVQDKAGNLYGTTVFGGAFAKGGQDVGNGTVFKLAPSGQETVLHSFSGKTDGGNPYAGLTPDGHNNFYGVALVGGDLSCPQPGSGGCGAVFKIDTSGRLTTVHDFTGAFNAPTDGQSPDASLFKDKAGNLFGTTVWGGLSFAFDSNGCGTVYEVNANGKESALYSFQCFLNSATDGWRPESTLVEDSAGNLYGTTFIGGLVNCTGPFSNTGCGTVFKLTPGKLTPGGSGWTETVLYRFTGGTDGSYPNAGLVIDSQGNLYGTTGMGGNLSCPTLGGTYGCGTVFKLSNHNGTWTESVVYAFPGGSHGAAPESQLVRDSAGNFYGTAVNGGDAKCPYGTNGFSGCGVVFKLDSQGKETVLHAFKGPDGFTPWGGLLLNASTNTLYGTTTGGGDIAHCSLAHYYSGCGVVYKVKP